MPDKVDPHKKCKDCEYFSGDGFECRRHAPIPRIAKISPHGPDGPSEEIHTRLWPSVMPDDWCGDYKWGMRRAKPRHDLDGVEPVPSEDKTW